MKRYGWILVFSIVTVAGMAQNRCVETSIRLKIKLIFYVAVIGLFCSFKAPLADMQYRIRNCHIDSIKSVNNWFSYMHLRRIRYIKLSVIRTM